MNLIAGWIGIVLGCLSGAVLGLFFHRENWLGGYASWPRRMLRLGHISLIAIGLLNMAFTITFMATAVTTPALAPKLFAASLAAMPAVCFLAAAWKPFQALFPIPAFCLTAAVAITLWRLVHI